MAFKETPFFFITIIYSREKKCLSTSLYTFIFFYDTVDIIQKERGIYVRINRSRRFNWI